MTLDDEYPGESQLPGSEYTGESITNTNNFLKSQKNSKSFLGMSNGTRRSCLMKKTRVKKSRDTVPLNEVADELKIRFLMWQAMNIHFPIII